MDIVSTGREYPTPSNTVIGSFRNPTIIERLKSRKKDLESNLAEVNEALEGLEKNPDVARVLELISKVNY